MNKKTVYGVLLALSLSALIYFSESPEKILGTYNNLETEVDASPFAVAKGALTTIYNEQGKVNYTFNALRLEHYKAEDFASEEHIELSEGDVFTLIERPQLIIYQDKEPWYIVANKGKLTSADQQIELWQDVQIKHISKMGVTTEITTERLFIDPITKYAKTNETVKITSDKIVLHGLGMTADLNQEKIRLLSQVHGIHDPS